MPYSNTGSLTNSLYIYPATRYGTDILILSKIFDSSLSPSVLYSLPIDINEFDHNEHWLEAFSDSERNYDYFNRPASYQVRKITDRYIIGLGGSNIPPSYLPYQQQIPTSPVYEDFISNLTYEWLYVMNPLIERIHIPMTRERIYRGKIPTTISVSLNGTHPVNNIILSHKFLESNTYIYETGHLPTPDTSRLQFPSITNLDTSLFHDSLFVKATVVDNTLYFNPVTENANTVNDYLAIQIQVKRVAEGLKRYRDTGNLMRIPMSLKSNTDVFQKFYHQETKTKTLVCDFNGLTITQKHFMPYKLIQLNTYDSVVANDYSLGFYSETNFTYQGNTLYSIRRGGTVVSVFKTASNKIKIKVKNVVSGIQYGICFAGLTGNKYKVNGTIINDADGNELETKYTTVTI